MASETVDFQPGRWARITAVLLHEVRLVIPPTMFFFCRV